MLSTIFLLTTLLIAEPVVSESTTDELGIRTHRVTSEFQSGETLLRVLMPEKIEPNAKLKTLYILPVEANSENRYGDGLLEAKRLDLANKYRLICVAPTFSHLPWYADHPIDKTIRQEAYFLEVVIPAIEKHYSAINEQSGRLLVGFSKSGYGAWSLLLRHPDQFSKAAAWDAPLMKTAPDQFGMGSIYGTSENFAGYRLDQLLRERTELLRAKSESQPGVRLIHFGFDNFRDHHERAEALLNELEIPHSYIDGPKRPHTWHSGWLAEAVELLVDGV